MTKSLLQQERMDKWVGWTGKPFVIAEWYSAS